MNTSIDRCVSPGCCTVHHRVLIRIDDPRQLRRGPWRIQAVPTVPPRTAVIFHQTFPGKEPFRRNPALRYKRNRFESPAWIAFSVRYYSLWIVQVALQSDFKYLAKLRSKFATFFEWPFSLRASRPRFSSSSSRGCQSVQSEATELSTILVAMNGGWIHIDSAKMKSGLLRAEGGYRSLG